MILGRGNAVTDEAIRAEYMEFLQAVSGIDTKRVRQRVVKAASTMCQQKG
jgi:hypothetical protein